MRSASAVALVAAGDGVWYTFDGGQLRANHDTPYSAWSEWALDGEPRPLKLVRSAILAASPHNTQPWRFRVAESFVELYLEAGRSVSGLDPYLREAHIGMGCALENLALSAAANGFSAKVTLVEGRLDAPQVQPPLRLVARVDLSPAERRLSELHDAIPKRHTNRSPYDPAKELPPGFAAEMHSLGEASEEVRMFLFAEDAQRKELVRVSALANLELYSDPGVENGSEQWIRWRSADIQKFKDGLTIDNFGLSPFSAAIAKVSPVWLLKRAASPSHRAALYAKQMESARIIGILTVRDRLQQRCCLEAGRLWQRAHLLATVRGVGARPCNEAIEMIDHERSLGRPARRLDELASVIGDPSWQPTFLFLLGQPTLEAPASPRRPAESVEVV